MRSEENGAGFVAGFLLGGLAGAAVALLLTPRSGDETRDVLVDTGIELKVKAEGVVSRAREEADDLLARGKTILEEQKARVQEAVDVGKDAAAQKRSELTARYQVAKKEGEVPLTEEFPLPEQNSEQHE